MQESFRALSLSHQKATVQVRELMHLSAESSQNLLLQLREALGLEEAMVLSTCNRTEIYYSSNEDRSTEVLKLICIEKGLSDPLQYESFFERIGDEKEAVQHLFQVSMGLHSLVIGDLQISNQVKQAYASSAEAKLSGPFLHRLMHTIFHANKRVQQETAYRDGAASVSYASSELAKELVQGQHSPAVLLIGLGEMGRDVAHNLAGVFPRFVLCNRTDEKAEALASEIGAEFLPFEELKKALPDFSLVISAVGGEQPLLYKGDFDKGTGFSQQFVIDLGVPRSIDPTVGSLAGRLIYDIDEIKLRTDEAVRERVAAIPEVQAIIDELIHGFAEWRKELSISPVIQRFKEALEDIRKEEMARYLKHVSEAEAELLDKVTKGMVNKIIKLPVLQLKAACKRGDEDNLVGVLNDLFNLEMKTELV